jgi:hypothetical protein
VSVVTSSPPYLCGEARCTGIGPVDYLRYTPLLPDVTGGVVDPRFNTIPLSDNLTGVRLVRRWRRRYSPGRLERVIVEKPRRRCVSLSAPHPGELRARMRTTHPMRSDSRR